MAKGIFCVALTACLLASAQSLLVLPDIGHLVKQIVAPVNSAVSELTNTVGNVAGTVTNVTNGLVVTVTNVAGGQKGGLSGDIILNLLNPLLYAINLTVNSLTKGLDVGGLTVTVGQVLQTAVDTPLKIVNQLTNTAAGGLNPAYLVGNVTGALKPVLDAVGNLTNQLAGTGAVGCILNSATTGLKTIVFTVTNEIINCGIPKTKDLFNITANITSVVGKVVNTTTNLVVNTTKCLQQSAAYPNIGATVGCVVDPVKNSVSVATNTLASATPIVSDALGSLAQLPGCAVTAVTKAVNETAVLLQSILHCALGKGVNASLPNIPNIVPNFTAIANISLSAIEEIVSSALGPKNPLNNLIATLDKLKNVALTLTPNAIDSVNTTIQSVQELINLASKSTNHIPGAVACVSNAQKALNILDNQAVNYVVSCTTNLGNNTAALATAAAAFDIGLKTDLLKAGANALTKCYQFALAIDNAAEKCFDKAIFELKNYVLEQFAKINKATTTAQALIDDAQKCLANGVNWTNNASQELVGQLKACLAGQGVVIKTEDITTVVVAGKAAIEQSAAGLAATVNFATATVVNLQASVNWIASIDKAAVENAIMGSVAGAQNAVLQVEAALKDNTNPAVKACIHSAKDRPGKLEASAVSATLTCVSNNKQKAEALVAQVVEEVNALKEKVSVASVKAVQQCSASSSKAIAEKCFVDFEINLEADAKQTEDRIKTAAAMMQGTVDDSIKCVNDGSASASKMAFDELDAFSACLGAQGITVKFTRN